MAFWILKEEPDHYSFDDLVKDGSARWTGVHNPLALRHLRTMAPGDRALYYHTGSERACVGLVKVTTGPAPDPGDPRPSWWVTVSPVRPLRRPIPLREIALDPALTNLDLLRISRLSVVPVSPDHWARLLAHESATAPGDRPTARGPGRARASAPRRRPIAGKRRR